MKFVKKFQKEEDVKMLYNPNVVLVKEPRKILYDVMPNYSALPLYVEAIKDLTVSFSNTYEYSEDNVTWSVGTISAKISVSAGERVYFRTTAKVQNGYGEVGSLYISGGACNIAGNAMSMAYGEEFKGKMEVTKYLFYGLIGGTSRIDASNLILPATTLAPSCYSKMFKGCENLIAAPELPATTLAENCYNSMFWGCKSLVVAPVLPATTLAGHCYREMFNDCISLNYIKMLATDISAEACLYSWFYGVGSKGTFVKNAAATWDKRGADGIPYGWTIETTES